jgi:hypothetical protein
MSLQATEAVLVEIDKEGNILREDKIKIELVQRGDILKVLLLSLDCSVEVFHRERTIAYVLSCFLTEYVAFMTGSVTIYSDRVEL